jgi:hypothetical protein
MTSGGSLIDLNGGWVEKFQPSQLAVAPTRTPVDAPWPKWDCGRTEEQGPTAQHLLLDHRQLNRQLDQTQH